MINISLLSISATECVTDLDLQSEMITLGSLLTTFESSVIFKVAGSSLT